MYNLDIRYDLKNEYTFRFDTEDEYLKFLRWLGPKVQVKIAEVQAKRHSEKDFEVDGHMFFFVENNAYISFHDGNAVAINPLFFNDEPTGTWRYRYKDQRDNIEYGSPELCAMAFLKSVKSRLVNIARPGCNHCDGECAGPDPDDDSKKPCPG